MCFSAPASFAGSGVLLVIGVIAVQQSKTVAQYVFACTPLLFAFQQFSEGWLWMTIPHTTDVGFKNVSMYTFLLFAQVVWPSFVPLTMILFEHNTRRKQVLYFLFGTGMATSLYLSYCLVHYDVSAAIAGHHIQYELNFPTALKWISGFTYILAAVVSPFVSSSKRLRLFGLMLLSSYLVSRIFYRDYLTSVWCYFAAILSIIVVFIIRGLNKRASAMS